MRPRRLRRLDGLNVFITGAASGIGRATAEAVAAGGGRLFLTDVQADLLAATAAVDPRARAARWSLAEPVDVTDHDAVRRLARQAHRRARRHGRRDEHRRRLGLGHGPVARARDLATAGGGQPDGADPRHRGAGAAHGGGRPWWSSRQRLVGRGDHRDALARGVQRQQVRAPRRLGGAPLRPRPARHRRLAGLPRRGAHPADRHRPDRRRRHDQPAVPQGAGAVPRARRLARSTRPRRSSRAYAATGTGSTPPPTSG